MAALGKKRKRTEEESTKPSKKAAKVSATTQISFSSIASDDAFAPIIGRQMQRCNAARIQMLICPIQ